MNPKTLIHDPEKAQSYLKEINGDKVVALKPLKIYIPSRFAECNLASIGIENYIVGIYAIVVEEQFFGVSLVNAMMQIEPTSTMRVECDGDEYFEFYFAAGSTVFSTTQLVKTDTLVYRIYNEIIASGKEPWYLDYERMAHLFDSAKYHAGANIGQDPKVTELIVSMVSRDAKDRTKYYRQTVVSFEDLKKNPPVFIPLRSVEYSATNTTNKLGGSYWDRALNSALVSPSDRTERIEELLRR